MNRPLTPSPTPYLQAFVAVMESGAVYLVRVMACGFDAGTGAAAKLAETLDGGPLWDRNPANLPAYPVTATQTDSGEGWQLLKDKDSDA